MVGDDRIAKAAIVAGDLKLIVDYAGGSRNLYDLVADPGETRDLSAGRTADTAALEAELVRRLNADGGSMSEWATAPLTIREEERERLRALGYVE
jgi:hypothetical protein